MLTDLLPILIGIGAPALAIALEIRADLRDRRRTERFAEQVIAEMDELRCEGRGGVPGNAPNI